MDLKTLQKIYGKPNKAETRRQEARWLKALSNAARFYNDDTTLTQSDRVPAAKGQDHVRHYHASALQ